uniref:Uncharacterized protein n=1 Tax=Sinocyclocheilus grahami TaxID=75366 RepID=A0A672KVU3_SINGR
MASVQIKIINKYELLHYYIDAFNDGCDSGFGHDLARFLDSAGLRVFAGVLGELSPGALELKKAASPNLTVLQLDITNSSQITQAHLYIQSQTGEKTSLTYTEEEIGTISRHYNLI